MLDDPDLVLQVALTVESLLFGAFALLISLARPDGTAYTFVVPVNAIMWAAVVMLVPIGAAGTIGWYRAFVDEGFSDVLADQVIALSLLIPVVGLPTMAFLVALGYRAT
jgi:hypothetical protein